MNTLPNLDVKYAFSDGEPSGPVWDSPHEARDNQPDAVHRGHALLRLFITRDGRIVHTETVA